MKANRFIYVHANKTPVNGIMLFKANNCILISSEISAIIGYAAWRFSPLCPAPSSTSTLHSPTRNPTESEADVADFINHIIISFHCMSCEFPIEIVNAEICLLPGVVIVAIVVVAIVIVVVVSCRVLCCAVLSRLPLAGVT